MAPLEVPVDTNPIVKEPPVFADGEAIPTNTLFVGSDVSELNDAATAYIAYDKVNNELFTVADNFPSSVVVYDGVSNTSLRTITLEEQLTGDQSNNGAAFYNGFLYLFDDGNSRVVKIDPDTGDFADQITVTGALDISFDPSGNLLVFKNGFVVDVHSGFTTTVSESIDLSPSIGAHGASTYALGTPKGNLVAVIADPAIVYTFDGISASLLDSVSISNLASDDNTRAFYSADTYGTNPDSEKILIGGNSNLDNPDGYRVLVLNNADNGQNFTGNSGKTLESGKIYSFDITGPNTVTNPTLNDDGQGQYPIQLPGGASIPVGALSGNFDFLFDGSAYIVVSLTESMAQAIYGFPSNAGGVDAIRALTQSEYDAISSPDADTLYVITD